MKKISISDKILLTGLSLVLVTGSRAARADDQKPVNAPQVAALQQALLGDGAAAADAVNRTYYYAGRDESGKECITSIGFSTSGVGLVASKDGGILLETFASSERNIQISQTSGSVRLTYDEVSEWDYDNQKPLDPPTVWSHESVKVTASSRDIIASASSIEISSQAVDAQAKTSRTQCGGLKPIMIMEDSIADALGKKMHEEYYRGVAQDQIEPIDGTICEMVSKHKLSCAVSLETGYSDDTLNAEFEVKDGKIGKQIGKVSMTPGC